MKIKNSTVVVKHGDICSSKCDVVVSSDDSWISQGGGVSKSIAISGGNAIRADARKMVPADLGDVIVTSGGELRQKYVFHAITIDPRRWSELTDGNRKPLQDFIVQNSMIRCFRLLLNLKLNSIAFPIIGTGVARIPLESAAANMAKVLFDELNKTNRKLKVELWVFDRPAAAVEEIVKSVVEGKKTVPSDVVKEAIGAVVGFGGPVIDELLRVSAKKLSEKFFARESKSHEGDVAPEGGFNCASNAKLGCNHKVFVSYSRKDSSAASELCEFFDREHIPYWIDFHDIPAGEDYKRKIAKAIREASFLLFLSSRSSNESENVRKEIALAVAEEKRVVPVRLDNSPYDDAIAYDLISLDFVEWNNNKDFAKLKLRNVLMSGIVSQDIAASGKQQQE